MTDLVEWLTAQLDVDERVAIAASTDTDGSTPSGEHWHWECSNCDTPIPITPVTLLDEFLECPKCQSYGVALRSVEEYPTQSVGPLPHFVTRYNEEQRPVDALHIANHDPAAVLRTIAAHRAILEAVKRWEDPHPGVDCTNGDDPWEPCELHAAATGRLDPYALRLIAAIYQDRDGFDPSWKVET